MSKDKEKNLSGYDSKYLLNNPIVKRKLEVLNKLTSDQAPISTSDPTKRDREIYISNLPEGLSPNDITELINTAMISINANVKSGPPVIGCWISAEQNCAFLEFRTPEEATNAFKLDGISLLEKVNNL